VQVLTKSQITHIPTQEKKAAKIIELTYDIVDSKIMAGWWNNPKTAIELNEKDSHWSWDKLAHSASVRSNYIAVGLLSEEDNIEAAMIYKLTDALKNGDLAGYIAFIATAPRNREHLNKDVLYKGCGSALMYWALRESYKIGYEGRIRLESLKTENTLNFYRSKGFDELGENETDKNLIDFELGSDAASAWMKKQGDIK
jgi:GNAT superfamily N-acetyltransferase